MSPSTVDACVPAGHAWRPTASPAALRQAAQLRAAIREWMQQHDVLEVYTPPLSFAANTDPQVESLSVASPSVSQGSASHGTAPEGRGYLHTSPEFAMKRVLCAYPETDIYQIATVFRAEVQGRFHVSQFTMLEWYRVGMTHWELMQDVEALFTHLWSAFGLTPLPVETCSYCREVHRRLDGWPDDLKGETIRDYFIKHHRSFPEGLESDVAASLDLFMDEFVLPDFNENAITFLYEYPASQAALAKVGNDANGLPVAERFEVFIGRVELANGFHELSDAAVQRTRFITDLEQRRVRSQVPVPIDENLLAALREGLPDCAGVAIGVERLLMILGNYSHINQVTSFSDANA